MKRKHKTPYCPSRQIYLKLMSRFKASFVSMTEKEGEFQASVSSEVDPKLHEKFKKFRFPDASWRLQVLVTFSPASPDRKTTICMQHMCGLTTKNVNKSHYAFIHNVFRRPKFPRRRTTISRDYQMNVCKLVHLRDFGRRETNDKWLDGLSWNFESVCKG